MDLPVKGSADNTMPGLRLKIVQRRYAQLQRQPWRTIFQAGTNAQNGLAKTAQAQLRLDRKINLAAQP